jgi:hypothetical protein
MDREAGPNINYMDPHISCSPCNQMMRDYDKAVVAHAVATGAMPLHEHREDFMAYQVALLNNNRAKDLLNPKCCALPNWESFEKELSVKVTPQDLEIPAVDALTGQRYCNWARLKCPLRLSFDRIDSDLPHVLRNIQPLLVCTNLSKNTTPDHDFRFVVAAFREHNKTLIGTEPPELTAAPTHKEWGDTCKEWKPFAQFCKHTLSHDGLLDKCSSAASADWRQGRNSGP